MDYILPNYYFVGSFIAALFCSFLAFFFLTIPKGSSAARNFGMLMIFMTFFNTSYLLSSGFYENTSFFPRWLAYFAAYLGGAYCTIFLLSFPEDKKGKFAKGLVYGLHILIILLGVYLFMAMQKKGAIFLPSTQFWDNDTFQVQKIASLFVLLFFATFIVTGIVRVFQEKGENRRNVFYLLVSFMIVTVVPGILHTLSRDGLVQRATYQTWTVVLNLIGFFAASIIYINVTRDKTTVLGKLVGISLVTLLLLFQAITYFWMFEKERNYDDLRVKDSQRVFASKENNPEIKYGITYDIKKEKFSGLENPLLKQFTRLDIRVTIQNTVVWHKLQKLLSDQPEPQKLHDSLQNTHSAFALWAGLLKHLYQKPGIDSDNLLDEAFKLNNQFRYRKIKLGQIPDDKLEKELPTFLKSANKAIPGLEKAAFENFSGMQTLNQKRDFLNLALSPFSPPGYRHFRGELKYEKGALPDHFLSYILISPDGSMAYETAYDYQVYRHYIAQTGWLLVFLISFVYFFVLIGFRYFFRGAIIKPIYDLITGLGEIDKGNFDARVGIHVQDEIGSMAGSFNRMARSIKAARMKLQKYAEQLEEKVAERTKELSETLTAIQALKKQQDGDYFLTTLLLSPLSVNQTDSEQYKVDFFVKQKKKFEFRHWSKDIGGDINIAHSITLRGKKYVVFINADAMGKSLQGAGGALVIGAVFHTIIERTSLMDEPRNFFPERWIKSTFIELHRVFESFDGSMLISMFLGLAEENTGLLYYINAEHPHAILYRDGVASFFESSEIIYRKLGTSGLHNVLQIATFQMEPGDIIFLGTDGRDDLVIGIDESGERIINEDETLVLRALERAGGNFEKIEAEITKTGELMDDLAMIRVEWQPSHIGVFNTQSDRNILEIIKQAKVASKSGSVDTAIKILEEADANDKLLPELTKSLSKMYYTAGNYAKAASLAEDYLFLKPSDTKFVFFASLCFRKIKDFEKSVDLSERLRLRDASMAPNLALLADLYIKLKKYERARIMIEELQKADPENMSIDTLSKKLEKAQEDEEKK